MMDVLIVLAVIVAALAVVVIDDWLWARKHPEQQSALLNFIFDKSHED